MRNPYEVLGVDRNASEAEIRSAFRKAAAQHHPDKNPGDKAALERFKELNEAQQLLLDPQKRAAWDRYGAAAFDKVRGASGAPAPDPTSVPFDAIFGDLLGALGIRGSDRGDVSLKVKLSFQEAMLGCTRELDVDRVDECTRCDGSGGEPGTNTSSCPTCAGRGKVRSQQGFLPLSIERTCTRCRGLGRVVEVQCRECKGVGLTRRKVKERVAFPGGVESGQVRVVSGKGSRVRPRRPPGDLNLTVEVGTHPFFTRRGDHLLCAVPISFAQAALGAEVEIPTLEGKIKLRVPEATQSGNVLRVRGKGVPGRGDLLVEITVEVPTNLSPRARQLVEELGEALGEDVQPQQRTFFERLRTFFGGGS